MEVTWIEDDICVCDNCGAFADKPKNIKHHKNCLPGESEKWKRFYDEANEEEVMTDGAQADDRIIT